MNALLRIALIVVALCSTSACFGQSVSSACALMTLDDAKSLIGADAALLKEQSSDNHCYYRSNDGAAYLHVATASGHLWTDYKADGKQVKGVGDEAYFYPTGNPMGNTLVVRKGDTVFMINAHANSLSDDVIEKQELAYSRRMVSRR